MTGIGTWLALAAVSPLVLAAGPVLKLYPDRFFHGEPQVWQAETADTKSKAVPGSIKAEGRWLVCSEKQFQGNCTELEGDYPVDAGLGLHFTVRSLRALPAGDGAGRVAQGVQPGGASLTGVASRYWPAPTYGSERVLACPKGAPSPNCAHDSAEDLCRRAGYRQAKHWQLQDEGGRLYLADVLCVTG